ncbi:MAG TPA: hypothetical protein DGL25_04065 [Dehalococcoidia bacterium]|nr:hypothetical protein [Dehalococcoidia bacterium]
MVEVPEMHTLVARAAGRRHVLEGLIACIPDDYWERRAFNDSWTAVDHLRHVATVDRMIVELATAAQKPQEILWLGNTQDALELESKRLELMDGLAHQGIQRLVQAMQAAREAVVEALLVLPQTVLDQKIHVAGILTPWGEPHPFPLRTYLASWAEHDKEHEASIRLAIETNPDVTMLTLATRQARVAHNR